MDGITRHFTQKKKEYKKDLELLKQGRQTKKKQLRIKKVESDLKFTEWVLKKQKETESSIKLSFE